MRKQLLVDARTARTGGGTTVLRVVDGRLAECLPEYEFEFRLPTSADHPLRPLVGPRSQASVILGLSESSNVGWPHQPYVMLARNWKCWGEERSLRGAARHMVTTRNGRRASVVVSATDTFADVIRDQLPTTDVRTVRFGVSESFSPAGPSAKGNYVLSVGDLYRHKRFDLAIDAFARARIGDDFELRIAGAHVDDALLSELRSQADSQGLAGRVVFMGRVDVEELASLYRGASATLLASDLESFGHPYVEAMASGCPIVGRTSNVAEEVTAGCAALVGADVDEMAAALEVAVSADRGALASAGVQRSGEFQWSSWASSLAEIIHEVT